MSLFIERTVDLEPEEHMCPKCGGRTYLRPACPGYSGRGEGASVVVCHPEWDCGNATRAQCARRMIEEQNGVEHSDEDEPCDWEYQFPMHEGRSEYAENLQSRPSWATEVADWRFHTFGKNV